VKVVAALGLALLAVVAGCKKDEMRPPPAPMLDGSYEAGSIIPPRRDAGVPFDAEPILDASTDAPGPDLDAGTPPGCIAVPTGDMANWATVTSASRTLGFTVTNAFATWDPTDCATPTVVVGLADSSCSVFSGHRLVFAFDRDSIDASLITVGVLMVGPGDSRLSVAYLRPATAGMGETWGTCAGSSGSLELTAIGTTPGERIAGTFDLVLSDCTDPITTPDAQLTGSFDVTLQETLADVCAP